MDVKTIPYEYIVRPLSAAESEARVGFASGGFVSDESDERARLLLPGEHWAKGNEWPASPVNAEEPGSATGQQSPTHALVASLTLLVQAIGEQTQAINRLADSNRDLVQAMAEDSGMDGDDEPKGYLNARTL